MAGIRVGVLLRTMKTYNVGAGEAAWLLNAKVDHYKLLSTGQVINPGQSI